MCPADPVPSAESGSPSGVQLLGPEPEDFQTLLLAGLQVLIEHMQRQTQAIDRLAQSNEALVQAMAEGDGLDDDPMQPQYLGRPR